MKYRVALFLVALTLQACSCGDPALQEVPPCLDGLTQACTEGICKGTGIQTCEDEEWGDCVGYQTVKPEICDGVDNDCDGVIDELGGVRRDDPRWGMPCGEDEGLCNRGGFLCSQGHMVCAGGQNPEEERCDGFDNDCDGQTDEDIEVELCYPLGLDHPTRDVGICHSGIKHCAAGVMQCEFSQTPLAPDCSNGQDNDCNGEQDPVVDAAPVDIALIIDDSCSMGGPISSVVIGVTNFAQLVEDAGLDVRISIIETPSDMYWTCGVTDFIDPSTAATFVQQISANRGGAEPTLDCMYGLSHPSQPFELTWRPGVNKVAVLFTNEGCEGPWCYNDCGSAAEYSWCDEAGFDPGHTLKVDEVAQSLSDFGITAHVFTTSFLAMGGTYTPLAQATGGGMYSVTSSSMDSTLFDLLEHATCGP